METWRYVDTDIDTRWRRRAPSAVERAKKRFGSHAARKRVQNGTSRGRASQKVRGRGRTFSRRAHRPTANAAAAQHRACVSLR
eukprot:6176882-Pleurochrysis_carterae.AAC.2